jgi:hypothetical protein
MKPCELYVIYRRDGLGCSEAARKAGYAGRPSPTARRLWKAAQKVVDPPKGAMERYRERMKERENELREMQDIARSASVLGIAT